MNGTPTLPQNDGLLGQAEREAELVFARGLFEYDAASTLPMPMATGKSALFTLPSLAGWFGGWLLNGKKAANDIDAWQKKTADESAMSDIAAYADVFATYRTPEIVTDWQDDAVFAAQRLAGLNPLALEGCASAARLERLRARLGGELDTIALEPHFGPGATLESVVAAGRLFVADYAALGAITADADAPGWQAGKPLIAPLALFARTDASRSLSPLAIGLEPGRVVVAPPRPTGDQQWAIAKAFVQSADYNFNQLVNHLAFTHLIEESFCLALHRRLAPQHPLYRLLTHHFTALLAINQIGVLTLISAGGIIARILEGGLGGSLDLIGNAYRGWSFDALDYAAQFRRRGLDDANALPYYPYRDDGRLVWSLLGDYLDDYVALYYRDDDDVVRDYELAGFAAQLAGKLDAGAGALPGFPAEIVTRAQLRDVLHRIVWTAGPQHAAVNYPQVDYANFMPNMPGATYAAPPNGLAGPPQLLACLPPKEETQTQVRTAYALAGYQYDRLLNYDLCSADGSQALVTKYYARLQREVGPAIAARNAERAAHADLLTYPYLMPENIPNSTSV